MKRIAVLSILLFILVQSTHAGSYEPIKLRWEYPAKADAVYSFDLDGNGIREIYVASYGGKKNYIYSLSENGSLIFDTKIQGYREYFASIYPQANEEINTIYLADLDNDKNLDVLVCSKIWGGGVNVHKFYLLEREIEKGFDYYRNNFVWVYENAGAIAEVYTLDFDNDGNNEIVSASLNGNVYVLDTAGNLKKNYDLGESVWGIFPADFDNNNKTEIVAGSFLGISLIDGGGIRWKYKTESKIIDVFSEDLDNDNYSEIIAASEDGYTYLLGRDGGIIWSGEIDKFAAIGAFDIDNDSKKEIIAVSRNGSIYLISSNGSVRWASSIDDIILSVYAVNDKLFVGGNNNIYAFELNRDYIRNLDAEGYYSKSYGYYLKNDYENARTYAKKAKDIYLEINNVEGILKSDSLLLLLTSNTTSDDNKQVGDIYYNNAVKYSDSNEFEDALVYAERALKVYSGINYTDGITKSSLLISEINRKMVNNRKSEADMYYLKAFDYYIFKKDLQNSISYAERAKEIYSELNDSEGISNSESLIAEVRRIEKKQLSDEYYSMAENYYKSRDYSNTMIYARKAGEIYLELNFHELVPKCDSLIALANRYTEAEDYYSTAQRFYNNKEYGNAGEYAKMAKNIYLELNDGGGVSNSDILITEIDKKSREKAIVDSAPVAIGVIVLVILLLFIKKKRSGHRKIPK